MARFNAAAMYGASDSKFQNRFNYLLDLLDTAYIVEKRIDGIPIKLVVSPEEGFAFYQGGGVSGWEYRGGLELIDSKLFLTSNAIKGSEIDDRYILWEDDPSTTGNPYLQLYDNDVRVGQLAFSDTNVLLSSIPISSGNSSDLYLLASQYDANPENYTSLYLYGNKTSGNYAQFNVYSNPLSGGGDYAEYKFSTTAMTAKLNGNTYTVWHSGNDGSGSGLDADKLDTYEASAFPRYATTTQLYNGSGIPIDGALSSTLNFNGAVTPGCYIIGIATGDATNGPLGGAGHYGMLQVLKRTTDQIWQIYLGTNEACELVIRRTTNGGTTWGAWQTK